VFTQVFEQQVLSTPPASFAHLQRAGDGRRHQPRIGQRRQIDEDCPIPVRTPQLGGDLQCHAGLAHAARPDQRHKPHAARERCKQSAGMGEVRLTTDQWSGWDRRSHASRRHLRRHRWRPTYRSRRGHQGCPFGRPHRQCLHQQLDGCLAGVGALAAFQRADRFGAESGPLRQRLPREVGGHSELTQQFTEGVRPTLTSHQNTFFGRGPGAQCRSIVGAIVDTVVDILGGADQG
jgi:hypothetical protein